MNADRRAARDSGGPDSPGSRNPCHWFRSGKDAVDVTIRQYRRRDRSAVLEITGRAFNGRCLECNVEERFGTVGGDRWQERKKSGIQYDLKHRPRDTLVAEVDGQVVGFVCTRLYRSRSIGHVANLAVAPEYQGQGIGRSLVEAALDHFRNHGMKHARVETLANNEKARGLYPKLDFEEVARRIYYFREL